MKARPLVFLALAATLTDCGGFHRGPNVTGKTIRYQVEYYNSATSALDHSALSISYATNDGEERQVAVALPWTKVVGAARSGFRPSVKAQFDGFGMIVCRIAADSDVVVEKMSSEDPYAVVECSL